MARKVSKVLICQPISKYPPMILLSSRRLLNAKRTICQIRPMELALKLRFLKANLIRHQLISFLHLQLSI